MYTCPEFVPGLENILTRLEKLPVNGGFEVSDLFDGVLT